MRKPQILLLLFSAVPAIIISSASAQAQAPEAADDLSTPQDFNNPAYVERSEEAQGFLAQVRKVEEEGKAENMGKVVEMYLEADRKWGDKLCVVKPVESLQRFVSVRWLCQRRIAAMGSGAAASYMAQCGPQARALFERGKAERNPDLLREVYDRFFPSPHSAGALDLASDLLRERGRMEESCARLWCLVGDFPGYIKAHPSAAARLAAGSASLGRRGDLIHLARKCRNDFPETFLTSGGRRVTLADFAESCLRALGGDGGAGMCATRAWSGMGGDGAGCGTAPDVFALSPRPTVVLDRLYIEGKSGYMDGLVSISREEAGNGPFPPMFWAVAGGYVIPTMGYGAAAFSPLDGKMAGGPAEPMNRAEYEVSAIHPLPFEITGSGFPVHRKALFAEQYFCAGVSRDRLYFTVNQSDPEEAVERRRKFSNALLALDLRTFRIIWARGDCGYSRGNSYGWVVGEEKDPFVASLHFHGCPVEWDGKAIVGATQLDETAAKSYLLCFDRDGRELWRTFISSIRLPKGSNDVLLEGSQPSAACGLVFHATNAGTVAAVDPETGAIAWAVKYQVPSVAGEPTGEVRRKLLFWCPTQPICAGGVLLLAPQETFRLIAVDPLSGEEMWIKPDVKAVPSVAELMDFDERQRKDSKWSDGNVRHAAAALSRVVVASRTGLCAYDAFSGKLEWQAELSAPLAGRMAVSGETVMCPTISGIEIVSASNGKSLFSLPWPDVAANIRGKPAELGRSGMNLVAFRAHVCDNLVPSENADGTPATGPDGKPIMRTCNRSIDPVLGGNGGGACPGCGRAAGGGIRTYVLCAGIPSAFVLAAVDSGGGGKKRG